MYSYFVTMLPFIATLYRSLRYKIALIVGMTVAIALLTTGLPLIFTQLITLLPEASAVTLASWLLLGYGVLWAINQALDRLRTMVITHVVSRSIHELTLLVFDHLQSLSLRFHLERKSGIIMSALARVQLGLEALYGSLFLFFMPIIIEIILAVCITAYLYGSFLCLWVIFFLALYMMFNVIITRKTGEALEKYNENRAQTNSRLMDSLINVETVRYFNNQKFEHWLSDTLLTKQEQSGSDKNKLEAIINLVQIIVLGIVLTLITWFTGKAVAAGSMGISDFVLVNSYLLRFIAPLNNVAYTLQQIRKGLQEIADVQALLAQKSGIVDAPDAIHLPLASEAEIAFDSVSFEYEEHRPILKNISFTIPAGKTVAIVGLSGSGKSTLVRLLFRFFDVTSGSIIINGYDIRAVTQDSLQRTLGIVPQETVLFNDTIYFNIAYGNPYATQDQVEYAAREANLEEFIKQLPDGYNTQVGERGVKLSTDEKQRIALARVILKNPAVYIFDEPTSLLDAVTAREMQKNIERVSFGKTTLIIAHHVYAAMHADTILVVDDGKIVEQGTHPALLAKEGLYARLWYRKTY